MTIARLIAALGLLFLATQVVAGDLDRDKILAREAAVENSIVVYDTSSVNPRMSERTMVVKSDGRVWIERFTWTPAYGEKVLRSIFCYDGSRTWTFGALANSGVVHSGRFLPIEQEADYFYNVMDHGWIDGKRFSDLVLTAERRGNLYEIESVAPIGRLRIQVSASGQVTRRTFYRASNPADPANDTVIESFADTNGFAYPSAFSRVSYRSAQPSLPAGSVQVHSSTTRVRSFEILPSPFPAEYFVLADLFPRGSFLVDATTGKKIIENGEHQPDLGETIKTPFEEFLPNGLLGTVTDLLDPDFGV